MRARIGLFLLALHAVAVASPPADLKLHGLFRDNMVLQCDAPVPVWGIAEPGRPVTVTLGTVNKTALADGGGRWKVVLNPLKAGGPVELSVSSR